MEEIVHQLVNITIIFRVLYIPGGFLAGFLNHQQYPHVSQLDFPGTDVQQGCTCNAGFEGVITAAPSGNPKVFFFFTSGNQLPEN